jgi:quercetin 2,3-dioxygenase
MYSIRKASARGVSRFDWLDSRHSFSFGDYHELEFMGYRSLRVINDDRIAPSKGFGTHPHRDMEIITYVLEGQLEHKDSLGTGSIIRPGEVQKMSAGSGILHSEFNPSADQSVHLLQMWILPDSRNVQPSYQQLKFERADRLGRFQLLASNEKRADTIHIQQDAKLLAAELTDAAQSAAYSLNPNRYAWLHVARGNAVVNGQSLDAGDGMAIHDENISVRSVSTAEVLLFDLA